MTDLITISGDSISPLRQSEFPKAIQNMSLDIAPVEILPNLHIVQTSGVQFRIDDNYLNNKRLREFKRKFTHQLLSLILESDFEYGLESELDSFILERMNENRMVTKNWVNEIFLENFSNPRIIIGILRIISRTPYEEMYPEGLTIALAALSHSNVEVKECGVRVFENWGSLQSLKVLEALLNNLEIEQSWLRDYVNKVIQGLRKELDVSISKKN
jgi:hypothetical protein